MAEEERRAGGDGAAADGEAAGMASVDQGGGQAREPGIAGPPGRGAGATGEGERPAAAVRGGRQQGSQQAEPQQPPPAVRGRQEPGPRQQDPAPAAPVSAGASADPSPAVPAGPGSSAEAGRAGNDVAQAAGIAPGSGRAPRAAAIQPAAPARGAGASSPAVEDAMAAEQRAAAVAAQGTGAHGATAPGDDAAQAAPAATGASSAQAPPGRGPARPASRPTARPEPVPLAPPLQAFKERLAREVAGLEEDLATVGLPAFRVPRERLLEVASALRTLPDAPLDYLTCLSGVDYPDRVEVVYHVFSIEARLGVVLKVQAPKGEDAASTGGGRASTDDPGDGEPWVPSVTSVWPGAEWHEREAFDLLGVRFRGHPDLRRILMPEGFSGGYPLRKDYVDRREQRARKVRVR